MLILSIIGMIMVIGLNRIVNMQSKLENKSEVLQELQLAMMIMERDFQQLIYRPILDNQNNLLPALITDNNDLSIFEFTRGGFVNPNFVRQRSSLQRIGYLLSNHRVIRQVWNTLDRASDSRPDDQVLLNNVNQFEVHLLKKKDFAHLNDAFSYDQPETLVALQIDIEMDKLGHVTRLFSLPHESL